MGYLIGIDEAGYGPNLGPLVIAATLWRIPGSPKRSVDLYDRLQHVICREPRRKRTSDQCHPSEQGARLPIADSKVLYTPHAGLKMLEASVLSMLLCAGMRPRDWRGIWDLIAPDALIERDSIVWHQGFNPRLPVAADRREVLANGQSVKQGLREAGVRLLAVRTVVLFPERFNRLVNEYGSKGAALSRETVRLLSHMLDGCTNAPILAVGDKHGGRNYYSHFLQEQFPDHLVEVYGEGALESTYRFGPAARRIEVRFRVRGEELMPIALASMVAKYFRELAMRAFNAFWCSHIPELKQTAGYPADAKRFKHEIAGMQSTLGIDDLLLWRAR